MVQFPEGFSTWSITRNSLGPLVRPIAARRAARTDPISALRQE